jgi:hypothetical protein
MADENNNGGGDGAAQNNGSPILLTQGGGGNSNGQGQQQQPPSPIGHGDWLQEGKFGVGLSSRLPEELQPYASLVKKFEGVPITDVIRSHGELEKKLGSRPQPPGPDAKPEEVAAWRKIVGTPEKPEDYKIEKPEGVPDELWNPELVKGFQDVAHKLNLSPTQAAELAGWWNGQNMTAYQKMQQDAEGAGAAEVQALKTEWGGKFDSNLHAARRVAAAAKLDINDPAIGNNPAVIRALHAMSALISEDKMTDGGKSYSQSVDEQMDAIRKGDDYQGKNGPDRQMAAAEKMQALFRSKAA